MGRYEIAKNKAKGVEETPKVDSMIVSFGPDKDLSRQKAVKSFYCQPGQTHMVGLVFNDIASMFVATKVHYHDRIYFRCNGGVCCNTLGHSTPRVGCALIIYGNNSVESLTDFKIMPFVFGKSTYNAMRNFNQHHPLGDHDFILKKSRETYNPWVFEPLLRSQRHQPVYGSLWQQENNKALVLEQAKPIIDKLGDYICKVLEDDEIRELIRGAAVAAPTRRFYSNPSADDGFSL